jgi:hypothetical protein
MAYRIKDYTKRQSRKLGVEVKPSATKGKKIDVFKKGKKLASVGAIGYKDYPTYLELERKGVYPKGYADKRRKLYKTRHNEHRKIVGTNSYYADKLLW